MSSVATTSGRDEGHAGGHDQGPLGARQHVAKRLDGTRVDRAVFLEFREVVDEGRMDHAV
jgi:hypothetical protein